MMSDRYCWPLRCAVLISFLYALLGAPSAGFAQNPGQQPTYTQLKQLSPEQLLRDLEKGRKSEQIYAAREFRRQVDTLVRTLYANDPIKILEAQQQLNEFDARLAPVCIARLSVPHLTGLCADILRLLETKSALEPLRNAREQSASRKDQKRLDKAIALIEKRIADQHKTDRPDADRQNEGASP